MALGIGGFAWIATRVCKVARRTFLNHIERLQWTLEQSAKALAVRTDLPLEVLELARRLGVPGDSGVRLVRLTQIGDMWLKPGSKPLDFSAVQTISAVDVGFLWRAWFRMAGASMQVIDYMVADEAGLEGRLLSALPIMRMTDTDATFRGEAMRYLAELIWNPDAILLNRRLTWRVLDERTLQVATGNDRRQCKVRLILDEAGDPIRMEADDRPRQNGNKLANCPWFGRAGHYRNIGDRRIPTLAEAGWLIDGVEFVYWRGRVGSWSEEA